MDTPSHLKAKLGGAIAGVLAAVVIGGAGLAFAQESPTTTEAPATETPATPAPDAGADRRSREGCDKDGDGVEDDTQDAPATNQTDV